MESTGKYWIPVFNILEASGLKVYLTHPKYVKAIKGKKTDKKDAKWIAELFKCDLVRASFIPPFEIRQLRDLCRYHTKLTQMTSSEKNRGQNCLTICNFKLDAVFSDVFGKSATKIIDKVMELGHSNFEVAPLLHSRCKATAEEVAAAIDGELTYAQAEKFKIIRQHMEQLEKHKTALENLILELAKPFEAEIALLLTVPGVGSPFTAIRILAEIGNDMSVFETATKFCSWCGVAPQNNESAGKKKTTRVSRAGSYLKPLFVQIVLAVLKSKKHAEVKEKYNSIKKRRGHHKAVIAITRRLLTAIWHMLSKKECYNPALYQKSEAVPASRILTPEQGLALLKQKGYIILKPKSKVA